MQSSPVCRHCGCLVSDGVCPMCGGGTQNAGLVDHGRMAVALLAAFLLIGVVATGTVGYVLFRRWAVRWPAAKVQHHVGPIASVAELTGSGRIYLVQIGEHTAPYSVESFAGWLRTKYGLDVQLLPAVVADRSAWNEERQQLLAELLFAQMKREHPELAADPNAYLIGFTDASMYSAYNSWKLTFTQRDMQRVAVVSASRMDDSPADRRKNPSLATEHMRARLRRLLLKDVAVLYWHLPVNNDPTSLLHDTLDPDLPTEDIYESDLNPALTKWGQSEDEPCVFFSYTAAEGIRPLNGRLIRACADRNLPLHEEGRELFQLDLRLGLLVDKHTDFELPDVIPIEFQRATQQGWNGVFPFGTSGTDNYDQYLASDDNVIIRVIHNDGGRDELVRKPRWLPILPLVKYVDTGSGRFYEMRWNRAPFDHYDLKRYDGAVESYLPCQGQAFCYLTGYRDAQGQELTFQHDKYARLTASTRHPLNPPPLHAACPIPPHPGCSVR